MEVTIIMTNEELIELFGKHRNPCRAAEAFGRMALLSMFSADELAAAAAEAKGYSERHVRRIRREFQNARQLNVTMKKNIQLRT